MRVLKVDKKNSFIEVIPQTIDDLWHLEKVIENGDVVCGESTRRFKPKDLDRGQSEKKDVYVEIEVERIEFQRALGQLRAIGKVVLGKPEEFVELHSHHSLSIELGEKVKLRKKEFRQYQADRLKRAEKESLKQRILLVAMDDEGADLAIVREFGLEQFARIHAGKQGKRFEGEGNEKKYYSELMKKILEAKPDKTIIAGPGFAKESLEKYLGEKAPGFMAVFDSVSSTGITGLNEIVRRGLLQKVITDSRLEFETQLVEKLFEEMAKQSGMVAIGEKETIGAISVKAAGQVVITDKQLTENRESSEKILAEIENQNGKIHIISSEHDAGKRLDGMGGIAAFLYYKLRQKY
ncbi:MAG: mRNA surveillance protein pelota [archaeon]